MAPTDLVSLQEIETARNRLAPVVHETPLDPSNTLAAHSGAATVKLKLENMQRTGSFKARGAYNNLSQLPPVDHRSGVVTISAGNHAQGVAYAARELEIEATVVMPTFTPAAKVAATRGYGADVIIHGSTYQELHDRAMELVERDGLTFVHPFDDPDIIAGQGTVGLEIIEKCPEVDTVVVAVGGGGLISGIASAVKQRAPDVRIVGVETIGSAHAQQSLAAGRVVPRSSLDTIAEGIAAGRLGEHTLAIIDAAVDDMVEVDDTAVTQALALLAERAKTVSEPAGAVTVAALLEGEIDVTDETVVPLISGGNADLTELGRLIRIGLMHLDRYTRIQFSIRDWPKSLGTICEIVEQQDAELADIGWEPPASDVAVNRHLITLDIEGTGRDHLDEVVAALDSHTEIAVVD